MSHSQRLIRKYNTTHGNHTFLSRQSILIHELIMQFFVSFVYRHNTPKHTINSYFHLRLQSPGPAAVLTWEVHDLSHGAAMSLQVATILDIKPLQLYSPPKQMTTNSLFSWSYHFWHYSLLKQHKIRSCLDGKATTQLVYIYSYSSTWTHQNS